MKHFDIAVMVAGLAGGMIALGAARIGLSTVLIAPPSHRQDQRTTMLMAERVDFLKRVEVWDAVQSAAVPVTEITVFDISDHLLTAPVMTFSAAEIGLDEFGWNFPNAVLARALLTTIAQNPRIDCFAALAEDIFVNQNKACFRLSTGEWIRSDFVVGSDGHNSHVRRQTGFGQWQWSYPQTALALKFKHDLPHHGRCVELHGFPGPFTQIPLPGNQSSLVWVMEPDTAAACSQMSVAQLSSQIEKHMQSILGKVEIKEDVQSWPLSGMIACQFGKGRVALIGEAAHVLPPVGAQGLNLSVQDILTLLHVLKESQFSFAEAGDRFHKLRQGDILRRTIGTDLLNRSLFSRWPFFQTCRVATFCFLENIKPFRQWAMRQGLSLCRTPKVFW